MTTRSWDALRPKLAPNSQRHKAGPIMLGAMAYTTVGAALMWVSLVLLFGITGWPPTFVDLLKEFTWRLILDVVCLYTSWSMISNGNNFFGVYRLMGYIGCLGGAFGLVAVARDLASTAVHLSVTAAVLHDLWKRP